jgi:hypothetical protein
MTTYSSSVPIVKDALVTAFQTTLPGVQVTYGWPGRTPEREWVMVGDAAWQSEDWGPFGQRVRNEDYTLSLYVNVCRPGDTVQDSTERAFTIMADIEAWLRLNPRPIPSRNIHVQIVPQGTTSSLTPEGFEVQIKAHVAVTARI